MGRLSTRERWEGHGVGIVALTEASGNGKS
jgi:hypothetical protein